MSRWRVTYASGKHLTVMATDEAHARVVANLRFRGDDVEEVVKW